MQGLGDIDEGTSDSMSTDDRLTTWRRALIQKLLVSQLVKKISAFCRIWRLIIVSTKSFCTEPNKSSPQRICFFEVNINTIIPPMSTSVKFSLQEFRLKFCATFLPTPCMLIAPPISIVLI
jgi:hypothetical protein